MPAVRFASVYERKTSGEIAPMRASARSDLPMSHDEMYAEAIEKIEKEEFSRLSRENARALFTVFDVDANGYATIEEIKDRLESCIDNPEVKESLQEICSRADSSGDGFLNAEEFYQALCLNLSAEPYKRALRGAERKNDLWVNRSEVVEFLSNRADVMSSFKSLPFYVLFFGLAFVLAVMHLQVENVHNSLDPIRDNFVVEVDSWTGLQNNFLDWMSGSFLEATNLDATNAGRIQKFNQIVGGVRLDVSNAVQIGCSNPQDQTLDMYFDFKAAINATRENKELKLCYRAEDRLATTKWLILSHGDEAVKELRAGNWIDDSATEVALTFFTYNAHTDFYVVSTLSFKRNKFGKVEFSSKYAAFSSDPMSTNNPHPTLLVCDLLFVAMVLVMMVSELSEMLPTLWHHGFRSGNALYWSLWNGVDWFNIVCSVVICFMYIATVSNIADLNTLVSQIPASSLDRCITQPPTCELNIDGTENSVLDILDRSIAKANTIGFNFVSLRGIAVFFAFSTMLAFFKAFRSNPRLRVVTDTMVEARNDFGHFLIVFSCIFLVFVLSGHILFGNQVKFFQNTANAIDACGMLMLGFMIDDIREDMKGAFPVLGVGWIWMFYIVISILLFNMILAIIFDVYADVKARNGASQTMFAQARELMLQKAKVAADAKRYLGTRMTVGAVKGSQPKRRTDEDILRALSSSHFHNADILTPGSLVAAFGNSFPTRSSRELVTEVDTSVRESKMASDIDKADILRLVGRVDQNIRDIRSDYERAKEEKEISLSVISSSRGSTCQPPIVSESCDPDATEAATLDATLTRLETYTTYRIDMIQDKFTMLLARLDRQVASNRQGLRMRIEPTFVYSTTSRQEKPNVVTSPKSSHTPVTSPKSYTPVTSPKRYTPVTSPKSSDILIFGQDGPLREMSVDTCSVCLEKKPSLKLCENKCHGTCEHCLLQYFSIAVQNALYTMPMVRCPGACRARIPTALWTKYARPEDVKRYKNNAIALLAVRCNACDETISLFESHANLKPDDASSEKSDEYNNYAESPTALGEDDFISLSPLRVYDDDNSSNTPPIVFKRMKKPLAAAFRNTGNLWRTFWNGSLPAETFLDMLIRQVSLPTLEKALHEESLLVHIEDLERRLAFQLAYLNRFPKIRTPCCGDKMCYKCKVTNWHLGISCEQRQRQESGRDVQCCPNCNVPTYRSEGCRQIHCVCGEDWTWVGDDDESSANSEEEQSTAFELVAMNMDLSHNQARMLTIQLAQSDSNLTIGLGVASRNMGVLQAALELGVTANEFDFDALHGPFPGNFMAGRPLLPEIENALFSAASTCPPWAHFYQPGITASDYERLSDADAGDHRLFTALLRLQMNWRSDEQKQLGETVIRAANRRLGSRQCEVLVKEAATLELCRALSEGIGFRIPDIDYVRYLLMKGADVTYRLESVSHVDAQPSTPLEMVLVNRVEVDQLEEATATLIKLLITHKVNLNEENEDGETPLAIALHYRSAVAVEIMLQSGDYSVSLDAMDDLASISDMNIRTRIENAVLLRIKESTDLALHEIESWALIQVGAGSQVKRLSKENFAFSEIDVKALLRTRAKPTIYKQMQVIIQKKMGKKRFAHAKKNAVTTILLEELREACELDREINFELAEKMIQMGANLRAREEEPSETTGLCNCLELIAMNWKAGHLESTRKLIERIVMEGGRSLLSSSASDDDSAPLSAALRMRNWAVAKLLVEHGAVIDDTVWTGCQECFGCDEILPILELLYKRHLEPDANHETLEPSPLWLLLRLRNLDAAEVELARLCEMRDVLQAAKDENSDYSDEVLPPVAAKLLCVTWILRNRDSTSPRFERIARAGYELVNTERSLPDQLKRTATHLLLAELRWRCSRDDPPDAFRIQLFLSEEADPNVRQNELTDYNEDDSETEFDLDDDFDGDLDDDFDGEDLDDKDLDSEDGDDS